MNRIKSVNTSSPASETEAELSFRRSGAVAKMLGMPVATLRVWERRYGLTQTKLSTGGQRLYSAADLRRLSLIKQLSDRGHAIGSLAPLDMSQLQQVASTDVESRAEAARVSADAPPAKHLRPWRLAVIGAGLRKRLQRPALLRQLGRPLDLLGPFEDAAQVGAALETEHVDALLIHETHLRDNSITFLTAATPALARLPKAVLYGFAADAECNSLADAGIALLREPQPDAVVAQWLRGLWSSAGASRPVAPATSPEELRSRRWDEAALGEFAFMSTKVACDCPRHVAELLIQLARFETYSAECENRNAADADLHAYLKQVAQASRIQFETALDNVAMHEGLVLPPSSGGVRL